MQPTHHHTLNISSQTHLHTKLEVREHAQKFYAVLMTDEQTLGVTESFNTQAAANMAGYALLKRYNNNIKASLDVES